MIHRHSTDDARARRGRMIARLTIALCLALAAAPRMATAQIEDWDEDGVADAVDACPDSETADLVGPDGCVVCSCDGGLDGAGWASRKDYLTCVRRWVKNAKASGTVDAAAGRELVRRSRTSTCGNPSLVRCCVYQRYDDEVGRCRVMTEESCDALDDRLFDSDGGADNEDTGSCLPNPCVF
jgi:hypothetical protein